MIGKNLHLLFTFLKRTFVLALPPVRFCLLFSKPPPLQTKAIF